MDSDLRQRDRNIAKRKRQLADSEKRITELDAIFKRLYEDNISGKLSDERFQKLSADYEKEEQELKVLTSSLRKEVELEESKSADVDRFLSVVERCTDIPELTPCILHEFVEKIIVHERARKGSQDTTQEVEIYFNFVGRYIPPALQPVPLTPEEQEELRKKEKRKDRLHQNYLRHKANGKQKEWEERYNAKRKAKMEAAKVAIRAENMEKGIFTTVSQLPKQEPRKATVSASAAV